MNTFLQAGGIQEGTADCAPGRTVFNGGYVLAGNFPGLRS
jgi:hypothetical protein